jgi:hypothetical protein
MNREIIILDTNVWISYLLSHKFHDLTKLILDNRLEIVTCEDLANEMKEVLQRKKFKKYITGKDTKEAVDIYLKLCHMVEIEDNPSSFTDKKDNFLIGLYIAAKATLLVTGDKRLLEQAPQFNLNVVTLRQFEDSLI